MLLFMSMTLMTLYSERYIPLLSGPSSGHHLDSGFRKIQTDFIQPPGECVGSLGPVTVLLADAVLFCELVQFVEQFGGLAFPFLSFFHQHNDQHADRVICKHFIIADPHVLVEGSKKFFL